MPFIYICMNIISCIRYFTRAKGKAWYCRLKGLFSCKSSHYSSLLHWSNYFVTKIYRLLQTIYSYTYWSGKYSWWKCHQNIPVWERSECNSCSCWFLLAILLSKRFFCFKDSLTGVCRRPDCLRIKWNVNEHWKLVKKVELFFHLKCQKCGRLCFIARNAV